MHWKKLERIIILETKQVKKGIRPISQLNHEKCGAISFDIKLMNKLLF